MRTCFLFTVLLIISIGNLTVFAQNYVGSSACGYCHGLNYNYWIESGHHFSMSQVSGSAPIYPYQYHSGASNVPDPPSAFGSQLAWDDVSYVIGGYYWKANFLDQEGYIISGDVNDATQWNIWNQEWVAYHPNEQKPFDCGRCHTTGYDSAGHQGGMTGIVGTWFEDGVGCEACHGPGS